MRVSEWKVTEVNKKLFLVPVYSSINSVISSSITVLMSKLVLINKMILLVWYIEFEF